MAQKSDINISVETVRELYSLMEEIQDLFHQPLYYEDKETVIAFAHKHYPAIKKAYYETLWGLLPQGDKELIEKS